MQNGFANAHETFGNCRFAPRALEGSYGDGDKGASIPVDCDRGPASNLSLHVTAEGKIDSLFLRPRPGSDEAPRCTAARARP
jgi:hypothetical protein